MTETAIGPFTPAAPSAWLRGDFPSPRNVITLKIRKGGGGKTTIARIISDALVRFGLNVLIIDMDSQGNISLALDQNVTLKQTGFTKMGNKPIMEPENNTIVEVIGSGEPGVISAAIAAAGWQYDLDEPFHRGGPLFAGRIGSLGIVPAYTGLDGLMSGYSSQFDLGRLARTLLEPPEEGGPAPHRQWDVVLIDNPPSGSNVHVMSARAAHHALIVPELATYAADSVPKTIDLIDEINRQYSHDLNMLGMILNGISSFVPGQDMPRRVVQRELLAEIEQAQAAGNPRYRAPIYPGKIPELSVVEDSVTYRAPVSSFLAMKSKNEARRICHPGEINAIRILYDIKHPAAAEIHSAWRSAWPDDMQPTVLEAF
jgi:chromosome partitioning protein